MPQLRSSFILLVVASSFAVGCDCDGSMVEPECTLDTDCAAAEVCTDGRCRPRGGVDGGLPPGDGGDPLACDDGRDRCGAVCCGADQSCQEGACRLDCGERAVCDGSCCEAGLECFEDRCVPPCDPMRRCGDACCGDEEACLGAACVGLGRMCEVTEECEVDEICLPGLGRCAPRSAVDVCEFRPPPGEFRPREACRWLPVAGDRVNSAMIVMAPAVANLTDDNGDGVTDTRDIPDIVFISFNRSEDGCCTERGTLRVVSGACNLDGTMNTLASIASPFVGNSSGIALGNLHPDTMAEERNPEIVATFRGGGTIAWRRTAADGSAWEELWRSTYPTRQHTGGSNANHGGVQPVLADLDRDGRPEVIVGNVVLDGLDGTLIWDGRVTVGPTAGIGNNAFLGPVSIVADIDLDGWPEVIAGNTVYDGRTGAEVWTYTFTTQNLDCSGGLPCDGFDAVGDFDDDPEAEIVIVRQGEVHVLNHDGTELYRVPLPNGGCAQNEGGPPTIADFDGDGRPEIGVAGADFYVVVDFDCEGDPLPAECHSLHVRWAVPNRDCSSRATGSSVFDFDGDGSAEVVYADEVAFRIFAGATGEILYEDTTHRSNTRLEMPIVVDVDNDGKSEVLVPQAPSDGQIASGSRPGLVVLADQDNNWVRTRRIWNQHAYSVTNVTEDGQIPRDVEPNWRNGRLNNFRQNVQPAGLFDAPDLVVEDITLLSCDVGGTVEVGVVVANRGALGVAPGVPVIAWATPEGGTEERIGVERTTRFLLPGQSERIVFSWSPAGGFTFDRFTVRARVDDDGEGGSLYNECDEDNNEGTSMLLETCRLD